MGLIRKTASIATLGVINFRSTKEQLEREQKASELTRQALTKAEAQVEDLKTQAETADERATKAELELLASEKRRQQRRRWAKRRDSVTDDVANRGRRARRRLRKEAKKAEKAAGRAKDRVTDAVA